MDPRSRIRRVSSRDHQNNHRKMFDVGYDGNHILKVKPGRSTDVDFSNETSHDVACEKQFIFSLFYDYIKYNVVRISDLAVMYEEMSQDLSLKNLDILSFLMATNKFDFVKDEVSTENSSLKSKSDRQNKKKESTQRLAHVPYSGKDSQPNLDSTIDILNNAYDTLLDDDDDGLKFEENSYSLTPSIKSTNGRKDCEQSSARSHTEDPSLFEKLYCNEKSKNMRLQDDIDKLKQEVKMTKEKMSWKCSVLEEEVENLKEEMRMTKEKMSEKCSALEKEVDCKDEQLERYENEMKILTERIDEVAQFKTKYEDLCEERLVLKQEIVELLNLNKTLEEQLSNQSHNMSKSKRQDIVNMFREEYKILQERIDSEWKERLEKQLEESRKSLETQVHFKIELMKICLNYQFIGNKYLIAGHVAQCYTALEVLTGVNNWMEKVMGFPVVTDTSEWIVRLNFLQKVEADQQAEYTKLMTCLNSESTPKLQLFDITLKKPEFPTPPCQTLGTIMRNVMTALYNDQRAIIQHLTKESVSQRLFQNRALTYDFKTNSNFDLNLMPRMQSLDGPKSFVQTLQNTGMSQPCIQQYREKDDSSSTISMAFSSRSNSYESMSFSTNSSTNSSAMLHSASYRSETMGGPTVGEGKSSSQENIPVKENNSIGKVILGRGGGSWAGDAFCKAETDCTEKCDDSDGMWTRLVSQLKNL